MEISFIQEIILFSEVSLSSQSAYLSDTFLAEDIRLSFQKKRRIPSASSVSGGRGPRPVQTRIFKETGTGSQTREPFYGSR